MLEHAILSTDLALYFKYVEYIGINTYMQNTVKFFFRKLIIYQNLELNFYLV